MTLIPNSYLQHFFLFITHNGALHHSRLERLAKYKHSSLLGQLKFQKENEMLQKMTLIHNSYLQTSLL
jgi:hypothetical protein